MKKSLIIASTIAALTITSSAQAARDHIDVVGSSTVFPFSTVVAETYGKNTGKPTPKIESTGTGGGMKLFCKGEGIDTPDITNASRRIKSSEFELCMKNGVTDITEVLITLLSTATIYRLMKEDKFPKQIKLLSLIHI